MRYVKKISVVAMLLSLVACGEKAIEAPTAVHNGLVAVDQADSTNVIILVSSSEAANRLTINAVRGGYQLNKKTDLAGLNLVMLDFERPPGVDGTIAINDMKKMEPSAIAELDHRYSLQGDTFYTNRRVYAQTMLDWPAEGCPAYHNIGIIDGHVDANAPAFSHATITAKNFTDSEAGATEHGTAIATLLIGPGKLTNAHLYSASVVAEGQSSQAGIYAIVEAINWMKESDVALVNISLAGPYNAILDRVISSATENGMIFVAAVGNSGPYAAPLYPAAFEKVIAVTAVDATRSVYAKAVRGNHVDFSAPGVDVYIDDGRSASFWSGTSFSAPFVTAIMASDAEVTKFTSVEHVRSHVAASVVDLGTAGRDVVFGDGLVRLNQSCAS